MSEPIFEAPSVGLKVTPSRWFVPGGSSRDDLVVETFTMCSSLDESDVKALHAALGRWLSRDAAKPTTQDAAYQRARPVSPTDLREGMRQLWISRARELRDHAVTEAIGCAADGLAIVAQRDVLGSVVTAGAVVALAGVAGAAGLLAWVLDTGADEP